MSQVNLNPEYQKLMGISPVEGNVDVRVLPSLGLG